MKRLVSAVLCLIFGLSTHVWAGNNDEEAWKEAVLSSQESDTIWDAKLPRLATEAPDFKNIRSIDSRGKDVKKWVESTVVVVTEFGHGSGAILSKDGWILTNYHVVANAVQTSAVHGEFMTAVGIITCEVNDRTVTKREEILVADVYKVDPVRDLALLKCRDFPEKMSYFKISKKEAKTLDECYALGSQGGGPAWAIRPGEVLRVGQFPKDFTDWVIYEDATGMDLERSDFVSIVTDCPVAPGDSGGPLVNKKGELIGLTVAMPVNASAGAIGYHIDLSEIQKFVEPFPESVVPAPLDPWTGGMPNSVKKIPQSFSIDVGERSFNGLILEHFDPSNMLAPIARNVFMELDSSEPLDWETIGYADLLPTGLWGLETRGRYAFDVSILNRGDGILATGYSNGKVLDEIRIDCDGDTFCDYRWTRSKSGDWTVSAGETDLPLAGEDRLGAEGVEFVNWYLNQVQTGASECSGE